MVFGNSIISQTVRRFLILVIKKCRIYTDFGVSQSPIFCLSISVKNIGEEMEAKYSTIYKERNDLEHQVKELEKRIKKLELEKEE